MSRPRNGEPHGEVLVLTDRHGAAAAGHDLAAVVRAAAVGGADVIVYREKDLGVAERLALGHMLVDALAGTATRMVVASDPALARRLGAWGVHLAQVDDPLGPSARHDLAVGRSCHDAEEVTAAVAEQADYVTVSPLFISSSKPGYGPALGPSGATALLATAGAAPPAYGLGGITVGNAPSCARAGLSGVAVMGSVMGSPDPRRTVGELVAAVAPLTEATP